jgi:PEP-CTERM motif
MKRVGSALVAAAALMSLGTAAADAAITCKWIAQMCPADDHHDRFGHESHPVTKTSVPEPTSLLLLGAGVSAVGAAVARRRKNKKGL